MLMFVNIRIVVNAEVLASHAGVVLEGRYAIIKHVCVFLCQFKLILSKLKRIHYFEAASGGRARCLGRVHILSLQGFPAAVLLWSFYTINDATFTAE